MTNIRVHVTMTRSIVIGSVFLWGGWGVGKEREGVAGGGGGGGGMVEGERREGGGQEEKKRQ